MVHNEYDWTPDGLPAGDEDLQAGYQELDSLNAEQALLLLLLVVVVLISASAIIVTALQLVELLPSFLSIRK